MNAPLRPLAAGLLALALLAAACGEDAEVADPGTETDEATTDDAMTDDAMDDDAMDEMADGGHDHGDVLEVPEGMAVPTVAVTAEPDSVAGHNLLIEVNDFELAPEAASTDPVDGQGHLHLYIDGERTMRFYNTAVHVTGLGEGEHELAVEVSANNHSAYAIDGQPIRAMTTITVTDDDAGAGHGGHGDGDAATFEPDAVPTIGELSVTKDPKSGWNVFADVADFAFSPQAVGGEAVAGQGHLHLYIDGEKVTRLYGPWWHVSSLTAGTHVVEVEAVADDHTPFGVNDLPVRTSVEIEVAEGDGAAHDDGHDDATHDDDGGHSGEGEMADTAIDDADVMVTASVSGDGVDVESRRVDVALGQTVGVTVTSDVAEMVHVHGYDLLVDVGPNQPAEIVFVADSPGVFEVELENSGRFLFELEVDQG